jgi:hypothetical protein
VLHLVTYDLLRPGQAYAPLTAALQRIGASKVLLSTWLLPSNDSPQAVRDYLVREGQLDANDRLLVVQVHNHAAWTKLLIANEEAIDLFRKA